MDKKPIPTDTTDVEEIKFGNKTYIVERHFVGSRSVADAVYTAVRNEANREPGGGDK